MCFDYPDTPLHVDAFTSEEELDDQLHTFVNEIIGANVTIDLMQGEVVLPKCIQNYKDDFGGNDENVLRFIFKYY